MAVLEEKPLSRYWEGGVHKNCGMSIVDVVDGKTEILQEAIIMYDEKDLNSFVG
jgi:probable phosphoglycerate mutase